MVLSKPFPTDTDRLISQVYANRQDEQSFFSVAALSFESLRAAVVQRHLQGGFGQCCRHLRVKSPADNAATVEIENDGQEEPASGGFQISHIHGPDLIERRGFQKHP